MARHTGSPMRAEFGGNGVFSNLLRRIAMKTVNEKVIAKADARTARAIGISARHKKIDLTDEQVIDARRAFEANENTVKELALAYGVTYGRMYQIITYQTRTFGMP